MTRSSSLTSFTHTCSDPAERGVCVCHIVTLKVLLSAARLVYRLLGTLTVWLSFAYPTWISLELLADKSGLGDNEQVQGLMKLWIAFWTANVIFLSTINGVASKYAKSSKLTEIIQNLYVGLCEEIRDNTLYYKVSALLVLLITVANQAYQAAGYVRTFLSALNLVFGQGNLTGTNVTNNSSLTEDSEKLSAVISGAVVVSLFIYMNSVIFWSGVNLAKKLLSFCDRVATCNKQQRRSNNAVPGSCVKTLQKCEEKFNQIGAIYDNSRTIPPIGLKILLGTRYYEVGVIFVNQFINYAGSVATLLDQLTQRLSMQGEETDQVILSVSFLFSINTTVIATLFIVSCLEPGASKGSVISVLLGRWVSNEFPMDPPKPKPSRDTKKVSCCTKGISGIMASIFALTCLSHIFFKAFILLDEGMGTDEVHLGEGWIPDELANALAWMYLTPGTVVGMSIAHGIITALAKSVNAYDMVNTFFTERCCAHSTTTKQTQKIEMIEKGKHRYMKVPNDFIRL